MSILASDGSTSDVQAKINSAVNGDTVTIPIGSFSWTSGVTISGKGITLKGAGAGWMKGSSATSITIGTGTKVFTVQANLGYINGEAVTVRQKSDGATNYMIGTVTSYSGTTLTLAIASVGGSGTFAQWNFEQTGITVITNSDTGVGIDVIENNTANVYIQDIHWIKTGSGAHPIQLSGSITNKVTVVQRCRFQIIGGSLGHGINFNVSHGVFNSCYFDTGFNWPVSGGFTGIDTSQCFSMPTVTQANWNAVTPAGAADTNGNRSIYVENCWFQGFFTECMDIDGGVLINVRYNYFDNCALTSHGLDTSYYGQRWLDLNNNTFIFNDMSGTTHRTAPLTYLFYQRGGTGYYWNNVIPNLLSSDYGDKKEFIMTVQNLNRIGGPYSCYTTYPAPRQCGQGYITGAGSTDTTISYPAGTGLGYLGDVEPGYFFGNTGGGNYSAPGVDTYTPDDCGNGLSSSNWIQSGRDFMVNTQKPGYVPFAFPHFLTQSSTSTSNPIIRLFGSGHFLKVKRLLFNLISLINI